MVVDSMHGAYNNYGASYNDGVALCGMLVSKHQGNIEKLLIDAILGDGQTET